MPSRQDPQHPIEPIVRKGYVTPKVEQVRLVLEEAVLGGGCKLDGGMGPGGEDCEPLGSPCVLPGS